MNIIIVIYPRKLSSIVLRPIAIYKNVFMNILNLGKLLFP